MLNNVKALLVVLGIALVAFYLCRPVCLQFMSVDAFKRRRDVWFALTVIGFLSPSLFIYAAFAIFILTWATVRDDNPLALFAMVFFVVPNARAAIPVPLVNQLFDLTPYRILSFAILMPAIWRGSAAGLDRSRKMGPATIALTAFLLLQVALLVPYESITNTMRRAFLFGIDTFVVFYVFNKVATRDRIGEVMASFWMCCAILAPIAIFESAKGWFLYTGVSERWGDLNGFVWQFRSGSLRSIAATNNSIDLGFTLAIGLGFYLYLRSRVAGRYADAVAIAALAIGILVTYSRGAWVTAAALFIIFAALRPNAGRRLLATAIVCAGVIAVMSMTPLKESVIDRLPFIGVADQDTIEYRQRLAETSWALIQQNPLFGDPFVYLRMESLRQGQGIIDIVNGYLYTALFTGIVGLVLQVAVYGFCLVRATQAFIHVRALDEDAAFMGASLIACLVATLLFVATAGFEIKGYILCGALYSYALILDPHRRGMRTAAIPSMERRPGTAA